jgi:tetratricopeptide (TPR) repeat protein
MDSPSHLWQAADEAARKALAIDESLAQASTTLACKQALHAWDWTAAEASFRNSIARNPRYATARHWYGIFCLAPQRRLAAAVNEIANAFELDPLSSIIGTHLGTMLYFRRQYREAIEQYQRALEVDPGFHLAYWHMGFAYAQLSQFDSALRALNQARELGHSSQATAGALGYVYGYMGRMSEAQQMLGDLEKLGATSYVSPVNFALIHTAMNNLDAALQWLVTAKEDRASRIVHIKVEPCFDRLKTDSRFLTILSSLDLL